MATVSRAPRRPAAIDYHSSTPTSQPMQTPSQVAASPQMFIEILKSLGECAELVEHNAHPADTMSSLRQIISLVSSLSIAVLMPSNSQGPGSCVTSQKNFHRSDSSVSFDGHEFSTSDPGLSYSHSNSESDSSVSYKWEPPSPASSPASMVGKHTARVVPGTPYHARKPSRAPLLTPPPSDRQVCRQLSTHDSPLFPALPEIQDREKVDNSLGLKLGFESGVLPLGFESSSIPQASDADFNHRATFHRQAGRGISEAYDVTLTLTGSTTIDGTTYNYSESLCRTDGTGITGYRYDNRNGSTYIRFDEPTGPRTCFMRHTHPPHTIPPTSSSRTLHSTSSPQLIRRASDGSAKGNMAVWSPLPRSPAQMSLTMKPPKFTLSSPLVGNDMGGSAPMGLSVKDFWR
ncbi:hypothetical protein [Phaffia rhodozyma]|uniref:Uncharacterized protein n=1 Tax=Phaffia rhodozyma TaxID=264483 RepID=A0A0F7SJG8_PHARH|nr:hypothetical protein [Phaffia rhodozyma]